MKKIGILPLTINNISITGTHSGRFQIVSGGGSGTIYAGSSRDIDIRYRADVMGDHNALVHIEFEYDGRTSYIDLPLSGETIPLPLAFTTLEEAGMAGCLRNANACRKLTGSPGWLIPPERFYVKA